MYLFKIYQEHSFLCDRNGIQTNNHLFEKLKIAVFIICKICFFQVRKLFKKWNDICIKILHFKIC